MPRRIENSAWVAVCLAAAAWPMLTAGQAFAGAFQLHENSTVSLGTAFAGTASAADTPATAFNNPAGMTQLPGLQAYVGGSMVAPSFIFHGSAVTAFKTPVSGQDDRDGGNVAFVPYGYVTYQASSAISVGLALTSPFGLVTSYGPGFVGRYQGDKTELKTIDINPNIAWKVTDWLSLGAGISAQDATAEFATGINSVAVGFAGTHRLLPLADGLFRLRSENNWAVGYNFGALAKIDAATQVGLTYRSRVQHDFSGSVSYAVPPPLSRNPAFATGGGRAKLVLPDSVDVSVTHAFGTQWTGYADLSWTDWSVFRTLSVYRDTGQLINSTPQHYGNTLFVSAGAGYALTPTITLRGGAGFDPTPVKDRYRTVRVPDANRYLLAAGASWQFVPRTTLDFAYSHIFLDNASIHETSATGDVLSGSYTNSIDIVSLGLRAAF